MSSWNLKSIPPHDWFICLDVASYFDYEHNPETIFDEGFVRPIPLEDRDIIVTIFFNGDPEAPEFHIQCNESLTKDEITFANKSIAKILGTNMDIRPLYDAAENDQVLAKIMNELYGLKRMTRANLFEDIQNRIVQMQINHKPTARKMMYRVRETYGATLIHNGTNIPAWPRPGQLMYADPTNIRKLGPTLRKGEYLVELATRIMAGDVDLEKIMDEEPQTAYESFKNIKGIGPTAAQDLIMMRGKVGAFFPSNKQKGIEKGIRRWISLHYGKDPNTISDVEFQKTISNWKGQEAAALEFLFVDWIVKEKERKAKLKH